MTREIEKLLGTDAWLTLVLGAAFVAAFLLGVAVLLLSVRAKGQRRRSVANLMLGRGKDAAVETQWMPAGLAQAGERVAEAGGFGSGLEGKLEQAGLPMKAGEFVALTAVCAVAGGVLGAFLLANIFVAVLFAVAGSLIPYAWLLRARSQRQKKMAEQLADVLSILASSLRAGHSFLQALDLRDQRSDHASLLAQRPPTRQLTNRAFGATVSPPHISPQRMMDTSFGQNECHTGTYGERVAAVTIAALRQGGLV